jgi:hypothetical protein
MLEALAGSRIDRLLRARALSERWTAQQETVRETLRAWMSWWRDVLLVQLGLGNRIVPLEPSDEAAVRSAAERVSRAAAREAAATIQHTLADLEANVNPRLALDLLLLRLPSLG